jgi:hypothetical protein
VTTLQIKYKIAVAKNRNNAVKHVTLCLGCNSARIYGESISYNINCILYDSGGSRDFPKGGFHP